MDCEVPAAAAAAAAAAAGWVVCRASASRGWCDEGVSAASQTGARGKKKVFAGPGREAHGIPGVLIKGGDIQRAAAPRAF